jgi:hypothetical protein
MASRQKTGADRGELEIAREVVYPTGIEPVTYGLEGRCSIQLSYGQNFWKCMSKDKLQAID